MHIYVHNLTPSPPLYIRICRTSVNLGLYHEIYLCTIRPLCVGLQVSNIVLSIGGLVEVLELLRILASCDTTFFYLSPAGTTLPSWPPLLIVVDLTLLSWARCVYVCVCVSECVYVCVCVCVCVFLGRYLYALYMHFYGETNLYKYI